MMIGKKPILSKKPRSGIPPYWQQDRMPVEKILGQQPITSIELKSIHGASILLAEDNLLMQEITKALLEQAGAKVVIANNGKEALNLARRECFDCVLMDVQMPEMDGLEASRLLRTEAAMVGLRIIAVSANTQQASMDLCLASGMDDFITKPFSAKQLFATIAKWLPQHMEGETAGKAAYAGKPEFDKTSNHDIPARQGINEPA